MGSPHQNLDARCFDDRNKAEASVETTDRRFILPGIVKAFRGKTRPLATLFAP